MRMSIRPRTLIALGAVLWMASPARAIDIIGRSPEGYECQGKVAGALAKLAAKVQKCRDRGLGASCTNEVMEDGRARVEDVIAKFSDKVSPPRCVTGICGREDSPAECAASTLDGAGDPVDGNGELGFKCLEKVSKLLVKFSRSGTKCRRDDAKAIVNGQPSTLDACLNLRSLEIVDDVVSVLSKQRDKGDSANHCGLRGECTENDDPFRCGDLIMRLAVQEAKLGAVGDGSDNEGRTEQCRDSAGDVLLEVAKGAADCREDEAKAIRGGHTFDTAQCLENIIDRWAEKLASVLAKASEKGVSGDRCIPGSCRLQDDPGTCARNALEDVAGL
jgi:hypothetical protein